MADEPSLYLTYRDFTTDERISDSWYGTQALADAAATDGGADLTAHQGVVMVPNNWRPLWIYHPTNDTWRESGVADLNELDRRKFAARVLFEAIDQGDDELASRRGIPAKVRGRVIDILAYARWAAYAIFFATDTYTAAQQIAWAAAMLDGPSDAADIDTLIKKCAALTDAEVPTSTSAWISPVDASRSTLAGSKAASARWNSAVGDLTAFSPGDAGWIENLT